MIPKISTPSVPYTTPKKITASSSGFSHPHRQTITRSILSHSTRRNKIQSERRAKVRIIQRPLNPEEIHEIVFPTQEQTQFINQRSMDENKRLMEAIWRAKRIVQATESEVVIPLIQSYEEEKAIEREQWETNRQCHRLDLTRELMEIQRQNMRMETEIYTFDEKKSMYEVMLEKEQAEDESVELQKKIGENAQNIDQILGQIKKQMEQLMEDEAENKELQKELTAKNDHLNAYARQLKKALDLNTIIKIQIQPYRMVGFSILAEAEREGDIEDEKMKMLSKEYIRWEPTKQRRVSNEDAKKFIILQLYRGWQVILRKIPYNAAHFAALFGQHASPQIFQNIKSYLKPLPNRASKKKMNSMIALFTEGKTNNRIAGIQKELMHFDNGLIKMTDVEVVKNEDKTYLNLHYQYLDEGEYLTSFIIDRHESIKKDEIERCMRQQERRLICLVDIPAVYPAKDSQRLNEAYEYIRKLTRLEGTK